MTNSAFDHVTHWVFDLDNTLYPPAVRLFDQIEVKMTDYMVQLLDIEPAAANELRQHYWQTYGTTLAGLMQEHDIAPDPFLHDVHQIDFSALMPDPKLAEAIAALPGRKIIYTNGTAPYAREVLSARGLNGLFDAIYGVEHANYYPKPKAEAYEKVFKRDGLIPQQAAMFEDETRNLAVPASLGMRTVLVHGTRAADTGYIDYETHDLTAFLRQIV
ncbi:MAG: pyrimidine 5'-nucleotidase [Marinovum sp.]|jgi:putative hydrolase of the HAD superfamily|nr:pyrimidine 5'-nucleotidase [Marinovum sp.]MBT6532952.1 pyrimidine 5'-nucleotidase [Marinovum sp.]MDG2232040.1 pyrimidine 5'-nucleotidase [Paracoccaceae bacterium]